MILQLKTIFGFKDNVSKMSATIAQICEIFKKDGPFTDLKFSL